jgi:hypothetical protein
MPKTHLRVCINVCLNDSSRPTLLLLLLLLLRIKNNKQQAVRQLARWWTAATGGFPAARNNPLIANNYAGRVAANGRALPPTATTTST